MKIIGGKFKGRKLFAPPGRKTRPTSAKVREAIFNICSNAVREARVADLFAGTGAMGIEALSRGAEYAVFFESEPKACGLIKKNLAACRAADRASVLCRDLLQSPGSLAGPDFIFDLVFIDPPYNHGSLIPAMENLVKSGSLAPGAVLVIEHAPTEPVPTGHVELEVFDTRKYGKTLVTFMSYMIASIKPAHKDTGKTSE